MVLGLRRTRLSAGRRLHRAPGGPYPILFASDAAGLRARHGPPIALFLSCYAGAIDARRTCLAAGCSAPRGGPVAVVAASRVTMPYATTLLTLGLMRESFGGHARRWARPSSTPSRPCSESPPRTTACGRPWMPWPPPFSPTPEHLAAERAEHVLLFNLLGDPLLRLRRARPIKLAVAATATAGGSLAVSGSSPVDGRGTVELVLPRDRLTFQPPARDAYPQTSAGLAEFQETYARANDHRLASVEVPVREGHFDVAIKIPTGAAGRCDVCVAVEGAEDFALGSAEVRIAARPKVVARPASKSSPLPPGEGQGEGRW